MRDGRRGGVLPKGRVVQRRVPLVVPQVDVGVCLQQGLHHLQVPLVRGNLQGSPALVLGIDLWEGQRHRKLGQILVLCPEQGRNSPEIPQSPCPAGSSPQPAAPS